MSVGMHLARTGIWVAVTEFKFSFHNSETILHANNNGSLEFKFTTIQKTHHLQYFAIMVAQIKFPISNPGMSGGLQLSLRGLPLPHRSWIMMVCAYCICAERHTHITMYIHMYIRIVCAYMLYICVHMHIHVYYTYTHSSLLSTYLPIYLSVCPSICAFCWMCHLLAR